MHTIKFGIYRGSPLNMEMFSVCSLLWGWEEVDKLSISIVVADVFVLMNSIGRLLH